MVTFKRRPSPQCENGGMTMYRAPPTSSPTNRHCRSIKSGRCAPQSTELAECHGVLLESILGAAITGGLEPVRIAKCSYISCELEPSLRRDCISESSSSSTGMAKQMDNDSQSFPHEPREDDGNSFISRQGNVTDSHINLLASR